MQSGFLRCSKYLSRWFLIVIAQMTLFSVLFFLYMWFLNSDMFGGIIPIIVTFAPLIMSVQLYTVLYKNTIGFGISRQNFFAATYVAKGIFAACALVILWIFMSIYSFYISPMFFINIFFVCIAFGVLGDLFGLLMNRFPKAGFVIYIIACSICGGLIGFFAVSIDDIDLWRIMRNPWILVATLIACGVITLVNWTLVKKLEIRG